MKDPSFTLRDTYSNMLTGNLLHEGETVGVYDGFAPGGAVPPYVILGPQTVVPRDATSCSFMSDCSLVVIVVTAFPTDEQGNKRMADDIANQITQIMIPAPRANINLGTEFSCLKTTLAGINTSTSQDKVNKYHEKAIRFAHLIKEL